MSIIVKDLKFTYGIKTPYEKLALYDINLEIKDGEFLAIIGHTGSGKSTFIQHLNALIKLQEGEIIAFDQKLSQKKINYKKLRSEIGMVFQYPENQLFDDTVAKDIAFGPKNLGLSSDEIEIRVKQSMSMVGLDYDTYKERSPFDLSGGEKRRVALAGVLSMRPKMLILDEPTAGLDPLGKVSILNLIKSLQKNGHVSSVVVISHDIDEISNYADRMVVFNKGTLAFDLPLDTLFLEHSQELKEMGLDIPSVVKVQKLLKNNDKSLPFTYKTDDFVKSVINRIKEKQ